jgi:hypothetical protein
MVDGGRLMVDGGGLKSFIGLDSWIPAKSLRE